MEIRFEKESMQYKPGQYLFLNIPSVSGLQWHPFTISSTPEEGFISVHIRVVGDWTKKAADILGMFKEGGKNAPVLCVDGPYGAPAEDLYNYKVAVLVGAGIGVTPAAALLKSYWFRCYRKAPMSLSKLYFFWVNRDVQAFAWFQSLLSSLEETVPQSKLEIHTYLTAKQNIDDIQNIVLNDSEVYDPVTELQTKTHFGRPNWKSIFKSVKLNQKAKPSSDQLEIGVFYCGPSPLAKVLNKECEIASNSDILFTLRKEHF